MWYLFGTKELKSHRLGQTLEWLFGFINTMYFHMGHTPTLPVYLSTQTIKHRVTGCPAILLLDIYTKE